LVGLGSQNLNFAWVAALLAGGLIAAPVAAWLVRHIPPRVLGSAVGGIITLTNARALLRSDWIDATDPVRYGVYAAICATWAAAVAYSVRQHRVRDRNGLDLAPPAAGTPAGQAAQRFLRSRS
jgi:hypothetical protein